MILTIFGSLCYIWFADICFLLVEVRVDLTFVLVICVVMCDLGDLGYSDICFLLVVQAWNETDLVVICAIYVICVILG